MSAAERSADHDEFDAHSAVVPLRFGRVSHTCERAVVIGSGPSLRDVDLKIPDGITVTAVNAAIDHVPRADFFFSLDLSTENRNRLRNQRPGVVYYAAVPEYYGHPEATPKWYRDPPEPDVVFLRRNQGPNREMMRGLSEDPTSINHGNAMWGGLQLKVLMGRPRKIALLGLDGTSDGYAWGEGSPRNLEHLPGLFRSCISQLEAWGIEVVNGSPDSTVTCFPRTTPQEAIAWVAT